MVYVTVKQSPMYRQMSIEDLLFGDANSSAVINKNLANTRTVVFDTLSEKVQASVNIGRLIAKLEEFNSATEYLRNQDRTYDINLFYLDFSGTRLRY